MSSRAAVVVILVASVGCHRARTTQRDRVLAAISSSVGLVIAAQGSVLASPRVRPIIDVLRPRWPASLGCVIDAALTSDDVALGVAPDGTTLAIATHAPLHCPDLSRLGPDLYVATLGVGHVAEAGKSVLDDPAFARVRRYLATAPIAASAESALLGARFLATATVDPLEAWVAIDADAHGAEVLEGRVTALVERMRHDPTTAGIAAHITVHRDGSQVIADFRSADVDLAPTARTIAAWIAHPPVAAVPADFACPASAIAPIVACHDATDYTVRSMGAIPELLHDVRLDPVVANGAVTGLRLAGDVAALDLRKGDQVIAVDNRPVTSHDQLFDGMRKEARELKLCIRRGTAVATLRIDTSAD